MENNIKGKVVVITGASSGHGRSCSKAFVSSLAQRLYLAQEELTELKSWQRRFVTMVEKRSPSLWM